MMAAGWSGRLRRHAWLLVVAVVLFSVLPGSVANPQPAYGYDVPSSTYDYSEAVAPVLAQAGTSAASSDVAEVDRVSGCIYDSSSNSVATNTVRAPNAYSVAYEVELPSSVLGRSRSVHFNRANATLDDALASDSSFARAFEDLVPGASEAVSQAGGRATPVGWVWHHVPSSAAQGRSGVMQLVPGSQHFPGSPWNRLLHPGGFGGYAEWAIPKGAPLN